LFVSLSFFIKPQQRNKMRRFALLLVFFVIAAYGARNNTNPAFIRVGAVYTMTNESPTNRVIAFVRYADGHLGNPVMYLTGGSGSGVNASDPLDSQDSVILSADHSRLYVCNTGSSSVSEFAVFRRGSLRLIRVLPSGGLYPSSIALSPNGQTLYIVNSDGGGSVQSVDLSRGRNSTTFIALNATNSGYPQNRVSHLSDIVISNHGNWLFLPSKGDNQIISLRVGRNGGLVALQTPVYTTIPTPNTVPFALFWYPPNTLIVAEAAGYGPFRNFSGLASFRLNVTTGGFKQVTAYGIPNGGAGCWVRAAGSVIYYPLTKGSFFVAASISTRGILTPVSIPGSSIGLVFPATPGLSAPLDFSITGDGFLYSLLKNDTTQLWSMCAFKLETTHQMTLLSCVSPGPAILQGAAAY